MGFIEDNTDWIIGVSLGLDLHFPPIISIDPFTKIWCISCTICTYSCLPHNSDLREHYLQSRSQFPKIGAFVRRREARKQKFQRRRKAPSSGSKHSPRHRQKQRNHNRDRHQSVQSQSAISVAHSINDNPSNRNVAGSVISSRSNTNLHAANPSRRSSRSQKKKEGSYVCDGVWLIGLFLQILGALLDFAALGYAPQSVVAPLGSLTLVVNVMVSPSMHREKPTVRTMIATMVIILGAAMTVAASPREDGVSTVDGVFALYEESSFLIYSTVIGGAMTMGWCLCQYYVYLSRHSEHRYTAKYYKQHRFVIAALSGTMGAQNVLFAKSVSTLLIESIGGGQRVLFAYWETYLLLIGLVTTIYLQLRWLNSGLKRFSALYVAPTFQAFWITVSVLGGLVVYNEANDMALTQKCVFPLGVIVTILGVFYLTTQGQPKGAKESKGGNVDHQRRSGVHSHQSRDRGDDDSDCIHIQSAPSPSSSPSPSPTVTVKGDMVEDPGHSQPHPLEMEAEENEEDHNDEESLSAVFDSTITPLIPPPPDSHDDHDNINGNNGDEMEQNKANEHGLIGLIKNLGDIERASIVGGASLGTLLVDPDGCFKDIRLGGNEEDHYFKDILSPQMATGRVSEPEITAALQQHLEAPEPSTRSKGGKRRARSHSLHRDMIHSETDIEIRKGRKGRKRTDVQRMRSRSHSPNPSRALTEDEMAPHEVVWERFTSMFNRQEKGVKTALFTTEREEQRGYASLEEAVSESRNDESLNEEDKHHQVWNRWRTN